ncbi:hypothetical protein INR49_030356 [Caranx melampygus]|nr:hypothetical protein INR49_030356 [Caranx melampygus]
MKAATDRCQPVILSSCQPVNLQVGGVCKLSTESSLRRCRTPDGKICSGRGKCDCGICICAASEPGRFYGPRCECHDWVCAVHNGNTCNDRGYCDCGTCECDEGWFGDACQFQEDCNLPSKKSKELCKNPQGVVCSNKGTCHCGSCMCDNKDNRGLVTGRFCECDDSECLDEDTGEAMASVTVETVTVLLVGMETNVNSSTCVCGECSCYDVDPSGDWGDIHGDTCECDERNCHATYDRYTDDFCSGHGQCNCGRCDCKEGWAGKKCEHPLSCSLSLESSLKKCRGTSNLPCFGRGQCQCGQCTCHPPGDSRVPVTVASVSVLPKTGGCPESTASVTTESVTNMMASSAQGMGCAIAATVSAGTAGQETLVKSGWELSTEENRTLGLETRGLAARSDQEHR